MAELWRLWAEKLRREWEVREKAGHEAKEKAGHEARERAKQEAWKQYKWDLEFWVKRAKGERQRDEVAAQQVAKVKMIQHQA